MILTVQRESLFKFTPENLSLVTKIRKNTLQESLGFVLPECQIPTCRNSLWCLRTWPALSSHTRAAPQSPTIEDQSLEQRVMGQCTQHPCLCSMAPRWLCSTLQVTEFPESLRIHSGKETLGGKMEMPPWGFTGAAVTHWYCRPVLNTRDCFSGFQRLLSSRCSQG